MSLPQHIITGQIGEQYAAELMRSKGYDIITTNWHMGHLEMDVICGNKKEIVFVEVKTRTTHYGGKAPEEYVDAVKQRRLIAAANAYIKYYQEPRTPRFDIIGISVINGEIVETTHLEDAFHPHVRTINSYSFSGSWRWSHRGKVIKR